MDKGDENLKPNWQGEKCLLDCLCHLFTSGIASDVAFVTNGGKEQILAHKAILVSRSSVFCTMLDDPTISKWEITLLDTQKNIFSLFLRYLYTDEIDLTVDLATSVLHLARQYCVNHLVRKCEAFLKENFASQDAVMFVQTPRQPDPHEEDMDADATVESEEEQSPLGQKKTLPTDMGDGIQSRVPDGEKHPNDGEEDADKHLVDSDDESDKLSTEADDNDDDRSMDTGDTDTDYNVKLLADKDTAKHLNDQEENLDIHHDIPLKTASVPSESLASPSETQHKALIMGLSMGVSNVQQEKPLQQNYPQVHKEMSKGGEHILRITATLENSTVIQNSTRKCPQSLISENSLQSSIIDNNKVVESTIEAIPKFQDNSIAIENSTRMCLQPFPAIPNDSYKCIQPASSAIAGPGVTKKTPLMPEQTTGNCLQLAPVVMECSEEIAENTQDCLQPIPETHKYSKVTTKSTEIPPQTILADLNDCRISTGILPNSSDHKNDRDNSRDESLQYIPQVTDNDVMIESTGKSLQYIPQVTANNTVLESSGESLKEIQEAQGDSTPIETHSDKYIQLIPLVFQSPKVIEKQGRKHKPAVLHDFTVIKKSSNKCNQPILTVLKTPKIMKTSFKQGPQSVRVVPERSEAKDKSSEKCLKSSIAMFGQSKPDLLKCQVSCTCPNCHDNAGVLALPGVVMSYRNQTSTDTKVGLSSSSAPYKQPVILIAYNKDNK